MSRDPKSVRATALEGIRVGVTRAADQAGPLASTLSALGAAVVEVPLIEIVDPPDGGEALAHAVGQLDTYEWVVLTSPNAAQRFINELSKLPARETPKIAVVGPGTASVVREAGLAVSLIPDRFIGEGLAESFPAPSGSGKVLFPRAAIARDTVEKALHKLGWELDAVVAYQTRHSPPTLQLCEMLTGVDLILLTSSSTAQATATAVQWMAKHSCAIPTMPPVVSIGPETTATAVGLGLVVAATATQSTLDGLVKAAVEAAAAVYPFQS